MTEPPGAPPEPTRDALRALVAEALAVEPDRVTDEATLSALGAESLDVMTLVLELEDAYGIQLAETDLSARTTFVDLVALVAARRAQRPA